LKKVDKTQRASATLLSPAIPGVMRTGRCLYFQNSLLPARAAPLSLLVHAVQQCRGLLSLAPPHRRHHWVSDHLLCSSLLFSCAAI
jgi:hypothetical protein